MRITIQFDAAADGTQIFEHHLQHAQALNAHQVFQCVVPKEEHARSNAEATHIDMVIIVIVVVIQTAFAQDVMKDFARFA